LLPMPLPSYSPGRSNALAEPHIANILNLKPGDRSIKSRSEPAEYAKQHLLPSSAQSVHFRQGSWVQIRSLDTIHVCTSHLWQKWQRQEVRLIQLCQREIDLKERHHTISAFQSLGYQICLVSVMESCNWELEFICDL
jgi:hypothetical protein